MSYRTTTSDNKLNGGLTIFILFFPKHTINYLPHYYH